MLRRSIISLFVVAAVASTGWSQVRLERKIQEDSRHTSELRVTIDQTLTIVGMETETNSETHMVSTARVGSRADDGTVRVAEKVDSLRVTLGGTAGDYSFDSANPDTKGSSPLEILRDVHKALASRTTTMVYDKDNLVQEVEFDENVLPSLPLQVQALVEGQMDTDAIKLATNQTLKVLPDEPVRKGDSWERTETANFGAGQEMSFDVKYTYDGTVQQNGKQLDKISVTIKTVDYTLEENDALPLTLKDSELEIAASEGTIFFDREAGRIVVSRQKTRIKGSLTFEANGQELPAMLDQKLSSDTRTKAG